MKVFTRMLCFATGAGVAEPFWAFSQPNNATAINVSHLLFAVDIIFFCGNDCVQMVNIRWVLVWFEAGLLS